MSEFKLIDDLTKAEIEPMKKGYSRGLLDIGKQNDQVVAASSDVTGSTGTDLFAQQFPERFVEVGIGEQNLVTVASGMAAMGKIAYAAAYAAFSPGRNWEQIRTTICLNNQPVKLIGTHAGLSDAPDGATHQILEDIALMRTLPNMTVIVPCDSLEAEKATKAVADYAKPVYIRIARDDTPIITTNDTPFTIGKAHVCHSGTDITIIATGRMTYYALLAAKRLSKDNLLAEVIHVPTIKPIDHQTILTSVKKTKLVITAEEAQINGGLGGAIAELLAEHYPTKLIRIGVQDQYGQSGSPADLFKHYGLTDNQIMLAAHSLLSNRE